MGRAPLFSDTSQRAGLTARLLGVGAGYAAMAVGCVRTIHYVGTLSALSGIQWLPRGLLGALLFYCGMMVLDVAYRSAALVFTWRLLETSMNRPLASKTLAEFWGVRWNRVVQSMLSGAIYKPCTKLGMPRWAAVFLTFAGSALLHVFPVVLANGVQSKVVASAAQMSSFFLLQLLMLIERWWGIQGAAWVTSATLVSALPLFVDPFLVCFGL